MWTLLTHADSRAKTMVDRATHSPSKIPVPRKSPVTKPKNGSVLKDSSSIHSKTRPDNQANGVVDRLDQEGNKMVIECSGLSQPESKGFETFLMTGDMMIRTTSAPKSRNPSTRNTSDSTDTSDTTADDLSIGSHGNQPGDKGLQEGDFMENAAIMKSNHMSSESGFEDQGQISDSGTLERDKNRTAVNDPSSVSDLSMASTEDICDMTKSQSSAVSSTSTTSDVRSDISEQTVIHQNIGSECSTDSSSGVTSPEVSNGDLTCTVSDKDETELIDKSQKNRIVSSKSAEKIIITKGSVPAHQAVRSSKSQELQTGAEFSMVNIDIDDNYAYSLDLIPQQGSSNSTVSLDGQQTASKSLDNSPEHVKTDKVSDKEFIPGFISFDDSHAKRSKTKEWTEDGAFSNEFVNSSVSDDRNNSDFMSAKSPRRFQREEGYDQDPLSHASVLSEDGHRSERDSFDPSVDPNLLDYQPPSKSVDQPSAYRLAKRLYNLEGFKKSDVARHLYKK